MSCELELPKEIKRLLTEGFYSKETKQSALKDCLQHNEDELARFIHLYIHDGATFVYDSLDVEEVELEGTHGTVSLSFYEDLRLGCRDLDRMDDRQVDICFDLTPDKIILHFIGDTPQTHQNSRFVICEKGEASAASSPLLSL